MKPDPVAPAARRLNAGLVAALLGLPVLGVPAMAIAHADDKPQAAAPSPPVPSTTASTPAAPASPAERRRATEQSLETVVRGLKLGEDRQADIRREIASLDKDRARINEQMIAATTRAQTLETSLAAAEARIEAIDADADKVKKSLADRRAVLADVLAALQRIGRNPPPAVMVRPEDALASIRSAILIGSLLPELRGEAEKVAADLQRLVDLKNRSSAEREQFRQDATDLKVETARLEGLMEERRKAKTDQQKMLDDEKRKADELAAKADSMKDLISKLDAEIKTQPNSDGIEAKPPSAAERIARTDPRTDVKPDQKNVTPPVLDPGRLQPAMPFFETKGKLNLPVAGAIVKNFGDDDGTGSALKGIRIATRPEARVASPCDGSIAYAGLFRSYGKVLIINAGSGYHVVLAGLDRVDVERGQFVLAGEPVGLMGARRVASAATEANAALPLLYVEFRKDSSSIDPTPWWVQAHDEKVRG
ncbi:MAG: peptidoglycan DD-metalloendopeptidase family protein [Ancalomicrobiaceae bacterium]|nr:peptidoglycan DD-metalloendopeptidase family protein [Ancalomicrobiaceae bacterium]